MLDTNDVKRPARNDEIYVKIFMNLAKDGRLSDGYVLYYTECMVRKRNEMKGTKIHETFQ